MPRARVARDLVPRVLAGRGARVEVVVAYETVPPDFEQGELERLLTPPPDLITFTSSSTASNFVKLLRAHSVTQAIQGALCASIGPVTSAKIGRASCRERV